YPIEKVWEKLINIEAWPSWWGEFKQASIKNAGETLQEGSIVECAVKGGLPYTLRFTMETKSIQPPKFMQFRITGDLQGDYRWVLDSRAGGTAVTAYWDCGTPKPIMNISVQLPFVKGVLERNHSELMANGYRALKSILEGKES
ncbi:MAG: Polyketide cyclase / dehydrase and lipid transport, partial [Candidatus Scalindua rubra]